MSPWVNLTKTYNKNTSATSETLIAVPVEELELETRLEHMYRIY